MEKVPEAPASAGQPGYMPAWTGWWQQNLSLASGLPGGNFFRQSSDYWVDTWQRSILFLDVLRERGTEHFEHVAQTGPNVLGFDFEIVLDGRKFDRPVNYALVRIVAPTGSVTDARKRPFIVFDPRAGHGPGIGGMKHDSEIGVVLQAGHPCYFVGFLPDPVAGQTIEDVCRAEARFVERVTALHSDAEGKPCLIGNCQAGWQIMMMSAVHPDLVGPVVLAGAPLSYWAGVHGRNPLRYLGGLLGGTWLTSLAGDVGNGIFDGAHLISNFENMNPANTLWKKDYHLYANLDTEAQRFLQFEKWWGSPVLLNAEEMQYIADQLFVGNKLSSGEIFMSDGVRIDLRNIKSPIVVFCSRGDDITPPQQALGWILDLYDSDDALAAGGQTIVYALHQSIGHLGIFVSAKVAKKEHEEFARTMDLIDALPPGLYEAVFTEKSPKTAHAELVDGDYLVQFQRRGVDDIREFGRNDADDDRRFATVARVSEVNQGAYRTFVSPLVQAMVTEPAAEWLRRLHPHRIRYEIFSDRNPLMQPVRHWAEIIRASRRPVAPDNFFLAVQEAVSDCIVDVLDRYRDLRDHATEAFFLRFYGSPAVQALAGMCSDQATARLHVGRDVAREACAASRIGALEAKFEHGSLVEAGLRALLYVNLGHPDHLADERVFATLRHLRQNLPECCQLGLLSFKEILRDQYLLLRRDEERALAAIPGFLPDEPAQQRLVLDAVRSAAEAAGEPPEPVKQRLARVAALFGTGGAAAAAPGDTRGGNEIGTPLKDVSKLPVGRMDQSSPDGQRRPDDEAVRLSRRGAAE